MMCIEQQEDQAWYRTIQDDVRTAPTIPLAINQNIATLRQFLTPLCRTCEIKERLLLDRRLPGAVNPAPPPQGRGVAMGQVRPFPHTTCTCLFDLIQDVAPARTYCVRDRYRMATSAHNRLLTIRQQNDQWLRETARDPNNPTRLIRLSDKKIRARERRGVFRGCRCGAEIEKGTRRHPRVPEVGMCLGCEGVVGLASVAQEVPRLLTTLLRRIFRLR